MYQACKRASFSQRVNSFWFLFSSRCSTYVMRLKLIVFSGVKWNKPWIRVDHWTMKAQSMKAMPAAEYPYLQRRKIARKISDKAVNSLQSTIRPRLFMTKVADAFSTALITFGSNFRVPRFLSIFVYLLKQAMKRPKARNIIIWISPYTAKKK